MGLRSLWHAYNLGLKGQYLSQDESAETAEDHFSDERAVEYLQSSTRYTDEESCAIKSHFDCGGILIHSGSRETRLQIAEELIEATGNLAHRLDASLVEYETQLISARLSADLLLISEVQCLPSPFLVAFSEIALATFDDTVQRGKLLATCARIDLCHESVLRGFAITVDASDGSIQTVPTIASEERHGDAMSLEAAAEILGIDLPTDTERIRAAYTKLVSSWHPDRLHTMAPELITFATEKVKKINNAYAVLSSMSAQGSHS
jgi:DnaJ-domain-containing protein 1